jgi:hypothetical protein
MFVVAISMMNFAGNVRLWLVDRDRTTLGSNKIADSGSVKLQSTILIQNLACAVYSYSRSAATEI